MIEIAKGNLLQAKTEAVVNTVNCVGFMGKGIALQFKQAFPANYKFYAAECERGLVVPGKMTIYDNGAIRQPHFIINFPTKRHWRGNSKIEDIKLGLAALVRDTQRLGIKSISIPPLGCGLGGLDWRIVRPLIEKAFSALPGIDVFLYEPVGAPRAIDMPVVTARPRMTSARALFIHLMEMYSALNYSRTLLEIQKLAYFLQQSGQPLRLAYEQGHYGPYATNLNKVLEVMEGHFIRGYGDSQKPNAEIILINGAAEEAHIFLQKEADGSSDRLARVGELIHGYETPYGMELLATTHWVAKVGIEAFGNIARSPAEAIVQIHAWNPRKKGIFKPQHIELAWSRLSVQQWL